MIEKCPCGNSIRYKNARVECIDCGWHPALICEDCGNIYDDEYGLWNKNWELIKDG